ncbi:MAG: 1-acyl-sn-glycerol-3-phosphate acyltransferase [Chloroflexi bacterium]|nr:1-acyl-sn-glycerol-3-phosphate acyltransferase [Chloroflexota bacterium]
MTVVLLRLFARWRVEGLEHLPSGPLIIASNHLSLVDPPLLVASLTRRVRFIAKREAFFNPLMAPLLLAGQSIPLNRGAVDRRALATAEAHIKAGGALALFPEGQRSRNGQLQPGKAGVGFLALRTGAPLLPVAITGTERLRWPWQALLRPAVTVRFGAPFSVGGPVERPERQSAQARTDEIMEHIAALLPEPRRGAYGGLVDGARTATPLGLAYEQGTEDAS